MPGKLEIKDGDAWREWTANDAGEYDASDVRLFDVAALVPQSLAAVPYIDQYFGVWAMLEKPFLNAFERAKHLNVDAHLAIHAGEPAAAERVKRGYSVVDGRIAVIQIAGPMMKHKSSFSNGTSTVEVRRQIRAAINDDTIDGIAFHIDSPGGTVSGTPSLAADIAEAGKRKPTATHYEDLGASAAVWVGSQSLKAFAGHATMVGSIGTYMTVADYSGLAAMEGVKVHVIRAGAFKGAGEGGTEITPDQLANWQRTINELNEQFIRGVAAGRKLAIGTVRDIADGRVHVGVKAHELGLIDGVQSFDETLAGLRTSRSRNRAAVSGQLHGSDGKPGNYESHQSHQSHQSPERESMSQQSTATESAELTAAKNTIQQFAGSVLSTEPGPATFAELVDALGCQPSQADDALFLADQLGRKATLAQATKAYMQTLKDRAAAREQELAEAKEKAAAPPPPAAPATKSKSGTAPLAESTTGTRTAAAGDPIEEWNAAVAAKVKGGMTKANAVKAVNREQPELRGAMLAAHNAAHGRQYAA